MGKSDQGKSSERTVGSDVQTLKETCSFVMYNVGRRLLLNPRRLGIINQKVGQEECAESRSTFSRQHLCIEN